jgi:Ca2+-transporting ATPase
MITSVLCNESVISKNGSTRKLNGSPTENALLTYALDNGLDIHETRKSHPLQKTYHRSESRNFMASLHESPEGSQLVAVKGSPAEVLALCGSRLINGRISTLSEENRMAIQLENDKMGADALRVLGFAYAVLESDVNPEEITDIESCMQTRMIWLGLVGMADPIREGVEKLINDFHRAGIKTVMITGDQTPTAYTVGRTLQLNGDRNIKILDSTSLSTMPPDKMIALCQQTNIFARVSPANKLQIVQAFQDDGKVVAMTGDGINDGPALKKADIGVAMGQTGTDVAREIADVVLKDDKIEIMLVAVEQGRTIYVNVRKALHFLLATNLSEIVVSFTANVAGMGQPLTQMQLLWINMITDIFPGLALSLEPAEEDIMDQPPRDPDEPIVRPQDLKRIISDGAVISAGAMGGYGYGIMRYGIGPQAGSIAFLSLTIGQLLHALHCRSEHHGLFDQNGMPPNRYLNLALGGSFALQLLAMFTPGLRSLLGISRIGLTDAAVIGSSAVLPLLVNNAMKKTGKKSPRKSRLSKPHHLKHPRAARAMAVKENKGTQYLSQQQGDIDASQKQDTTVNRPVRKLIGG